MLLGVEVFNSFKVEERVSGLLVVVLVGHSHGSESFGSPLGEQPCDEDVDDDCSKLKHKEFP
jgi:hypothetical protein